MDEEAVDERETLRVKEAIKEIQQQIMQEMNSLFTKISDQHSITNEQNLLQISSIVASEVPMFKRKSNEEQYKMNTKVMLKLDEAEQAVDTTKTKEKIIEAKDLLQHRQKIIKLADQSEYGWKVVTKYDSNPVASDSDDEKRIYKAEARASRKARSERGVRLGRWRGYPYSMRGFGYRGMNETIPSSNQPQTQPTKRQGICFA